MKILIVNDDGIDAPGIKYLADWAKTKGEVTVFAPKVQQSGKGHSIEINRGYEVKRVDIFDGIDAYSVDSTPADCVRVATLGFKKKFDLVLSGINRGYNLGEDVHYSGTVGACFEAAKGGTRAIALSTHYDTFDNAVKNLDRVFDEIDRRKMLEYAEMLNINIPDKGDEILVTRLGKSIYSDEFDFFDPDFATPRLIWLYKNTRRLEFDTDATMTGHISITPLRVDCTDRAALESILKR